jgi:hypothetical protein
VGERQLRLRRPRGCVVARDSETPQQVVKVCIVAVAQERLRLLSKHLPVQGNLCEMQVSITGQVNRHQQ